MSDPSSRDYRTLSKTRLRNKHFLQRSFIVISRCRQPTWSKGLPSTPHTLDPIKVRITASEKDQTETPTAGLINSRLCLRQTQPLNPSSYLSCTCLVCVKVHYRYLPPISTAWFGRVAADYEYRGIQMPSCGLPDSRGAAATLWHRETWLGPSSSSPSPSSSELRC